MLFSNQTSLKFPKFLEPLNNYDCSRVGLLGQGLERTSQDGKLTYEHFESKLDWWVFWFRDDLSLVNDKNTLEKHQGWMRNGEGITKRQECQ
jgi:hypothetical protein